MKKILMVLIIALLFIFGCAGKVNLPPDIIAVGEFEGECFKIKLIEAKSEAGNSQAVVIDIPCDDPLIKNNLTD